MEITAILAVETGADFRAWLAAHHATEREIWLLYPTAASGRPRIGYNEAVEAALCYGWIDSTFRRYDETTAAQRYSPRRAGSPYSQPNIERLRRLRDAGLILPAVLDQVAPLLERAFVFPEDILAAIRADPAAWAYYQGTSPAYRRIRVAYIEAARGRPDEFAKRLRHFIAVSAKGRQIGFGGIAAYY